MKAEMSEPCPQQRHHTIPVIAKRATNKVRLFLGAGARKFSRPQQNHEPGLNRERRLGGWRRGVSIKAGGSSDGQKTMLNDQISKLADGEMAHYDSLTELVLSYRSRDERIAGRASTSDTAPYSLDETNPEEFGSYSSGRSDFTLVENSWNDFDEPGGPRFLNHSFKGTLLADTIWEDPERLVATGPSERMSPTPDVKSSDGTFEAQRRGMFAFRDPSTEYSSPMTDLSDHGLTKTDPMTQVVSTRSKCLKKPRRQPNRNHHSPSLQHKHPPSLHEEVTDTFARDLARSLEASTFTSAGAFDNGGHRGHQAVFGNASQQERSDSESRSFSTDAASARRSRSETSASFPSSLATSMEADSSARSNHTTDDDDGASLLTEYTDLSLIEAFESSPGLSNAALLSALLSIKDEVVLRAVKRLQITTAQGAQQRPHNRPPEQSTSQGTGGSTINNLMGYQPQNHRKRYLDNDGPGDNDENDGDEKERRRERTFALDAAPGQLMRKFACPFHKRYPNSTNLQKSCHGPGWQSVHRVKEHIYRRHQRPTHRCTRCLVFFEDEEELIRHTRAEQRCEVQTDSPDEETLYISQTQERALRKRHRNVPELERWGLVFQILFPDVQADQIPSPYYEISSNDLIPDVATLQEFRAFVAQELPSRIVNDINNHLRLLPEAAPIRSQMTSILRETIQEVMGEFLSLPTPPNTNEGNGSPAMDTPDTGSQVNLALTAGNVSSIPTIDMSLFQPPWLTPMPPLESWNPEAYDNYTDPPTLHPVLCHSLAMEDSFATLYTPESQAVSGNFQESLYRASMHKRDGDGMSRLPDSVEDVQYNFRK